MSHGGCLSALCVVAFEANVHVLPTDLAYPTVSSMVQVGANLFCACWTSPHYIHSGRMQKQDATSLKIWQRVVLIMASRFTRAGGGLACRSDGVYSNTNWTS